MVKWRGRERVGESRIEEGWEGGEDHNLRTSGMSAQRWWLAAVDMQSVSAVSMFPAELSLLTDGKEKKNLPSILHVPESPWLSITNMSCHWKSWTVWSDCCGHVYIVSSWWSTDGKLKTFKSSFTSGFSLSGCLEGFEAVVSSRTKRMTLFWTDSEWKFLNLRC